MLSYIPTLGHAPELRFVEDLETLQEVLVEEETDGVQIVIVEESHHHLQCEEEDHDADVGGEENQTVETDSHQAQHGQHGGGDADEEEEDGEVDEAVVEEVEIIPVEDLRHHAGEKENHTENLTGYTVKTRRS